MNAYKLHIIANLSTVLIITPFYIDHTVFILCVSLATICVEAGLLVCFNDPFLYLDATDMVGHKPSILSKWLLVIDFINCYTFMYFVSVFFGLFVAIFPMLITYIVVEYGQDSEYEDDDDW